MYTHLVSPANRQQLRHCRGRRVVCMRCINNTCTAHVLSEILSSRTGLPPDLADKPAGCSAYARRWLAIRAPAGASVPHAVRTYASSNEPALRRWIDRSMRRPRKTFDPDDRSIHASITYFWPDRSDNLPLRACCVCVVVYVASFYFWRTRTYV